MIFGYLIMLSRLELTAKERKTILLASLGCVLEFYDFIIFGFMAINLISDVFAGKFTYHKNIFLLFCVLFLGYLIRPLGMKIYSKIAPVQETYIVDGVVTGLFIIAMCAIGLMPRHNYSLAIIILLISRIIQGIASGAEMQSNIDHLLIKVPDKINYSIFGIVSGNELGILLGVIVNRVLNLFLSQQEMIAYGWRITFFIAALLCLIIYLIRMRYSEKVSEAHCYREIMPLYKLLTHYPRRVLIATVFCAIRGSTSYLLLFLLPLFLLKNCHFNLAKTSHIMLITTVVGFVSGYVLNNLILLNNKVHYHTIPRVTLVLILLGIPAMLFLCYAIIFKEYLIVAIVFASVITGCFRLIIPSLIIGIFPNELLLAGFNFSNHSGFILCGVLLVILNAILAGVIHLILPTFAYVSLYYYSTAFYLLLLFVTAIWGIFQLYKYADFASIDKRRSLLLAQTRRVK